MKYKIWMGKVIFTIKYGIHMSEFYGETVFSFIFSLHWKPAGLLIGFQSEEGWFQYKLKNDPRFLKRIAQACRNLQSEKGTRLEDLG